MIGRRIKRPKNYSMRLDRVGMVLVLLLAWAWVIVVVGMMFFHGYYRKTGSGWKLQRRVHINHDQLGEHPVVDRNIQFEDSKAFDKDVDEPMPHESPLLIFTCNRHEYLRETLTDVRRYIPSDCKMGCPIIISQDGNNEDVKGVVEEFEATFRTMNIPFIHLQHQTSLRQGKKNPYETLAMHYGWALNEVFHGATYKNVIPVPSKRVIVLEEDIHIAPDFFAYFQATARILDKDASLLAISAFNDNGFHSKVSNATRVLRSDFFPGLGWMMNRELWDTELAAKWPSGYWDDWLREPPQRRGRHILRPEISRTFHFGVKGGASSNQFGNKLGQIMLNDSPVPWDAYRDLFFRELEEHEFDTQYCHLLQSAQYFDNLNHAIDACRSRSVRVEYATWPAFQNAARLLGLMDDEKAGIPRTSYKGVVETRPHGSYLLFLTPTMNELQRSLCAMV